MELQTALISLFCRPCLVQDFKYCRKEAIVLQTADGQMMNSFPLVMNFTEAPLALG